ERAAVAEGGVVLVRPRDGAGEVAVFDVGRAGDEVDGVADGDDRAGRGRADGDRRRGVDDELDRGARRLAARVADRGGDVVRAGAERALRDRAAGAERAVEVVGPVDRAGEVALFGIGRGGGEGDRVTEGEDGVGRGCRDREARAAVHHE